MFSSSTLLDSALTHSYTQCLKRFVWMLISIVERWLVPSSYQLNESIKSVFFWLASFLGYLHICWRSRLINRKPFRLAIHFVSLQFISSLFMKTCGSWSRDVAGVHQTSDVPLDNREKITKIWTGGWETDSPNVQFPLSSMNNWSASNGEMEEKETGECIKCRPSYAFEPDASANGHLWNFFSSQGVQYFVRCAFYSIFISRPCLMHVFFNLCITSNRLGLSEWWRLIAAHAHCVVWHFCDEDHQPPPKIAMCEISKGWKVVTCSPWNNELLDRDSEGPHFHYWSNITREAFAKKTWIKLKTSRKTGSVQKMLQ